MVKERLSTFACRLAVGFLRSCVSPPTARVISESDPKLYYAGVITTLQELDKGCDCGRFVHFVLSKVMLPRAPLGA
jgi:hypothetical protein